ncbi:hypothetical protein N7931_14615 [Catenovulum sp. 2E275]|uniref:hypothetical protein n=1 Tax=Catenovulum sp. 2E275 TaxID=2980497 RepID=UPI0021D1E4E0|nr:hypothetical protein [Catenovulum sp. 2E275]MCU4676863.1 hypothetical protein [Catenovulum sp. 2E275]
MAVGSCIFAEPCGILGGIAAVLGGVSIADGTGKSVISEGLQNYAGVPGPWAEGTAATIDLLGGGKGHIDNLYGLAKSLGTVNSEGKLLFETVITGSDMILYQYELQDNIDKLSGGQ